MHEFMPLDKFLGGNKIGRGVGLREEEKGICIGYQFVFPLQNDIEFGHRLTCRSNHINQSLHMSPIWPPKAADSTPTITMKMTPEIHTTQNK